MYFKHGTCQKTHTFCILKWLQSFVANDSCFSRIKTAAYWCTEAASVTHWLQQPWGENKNARSEEDTHPKLFISNIMGVLFLVSCWIWQYGLFKIFKMIMYVCFWSNSDMGQHARPVDNTAVLHCTCEQQRYGPYSTAASQARAESSILPNPGEAVLGEAETRRGQVSMQTEIWKSHSFKTTNIFQFSFFQHILTLSTVL